MDKNKIPLSEKPRNGNEMKKMIQIMNQETPDFVPSHEPVLKWFDLLPIHFVILNLIIVKFISYGFHHDLIISLFVFVAISFPLFVYSIFNINKLSECIFENRLVLPRRWSFTSVITNHKLIHKYKLWVRIMSSLVIVYGISLILQPILNTIKINLL